VKICSGTVRNPQVRETVKLLCADHPKLNGGLKILNVGFGLGIVSDVFLFRHYSNPAVKIDSFFQALSTPPALHVIIEAHPDVREYMRSQGWYSKPNVKILEGKWQDYVDSSELLGVGGFDVIYTDTFSEEYEGTVIRLEKHIGEAECNDQNSTNSSNGFQTLSTARNRDSASSTAWERRVGIDYGEVSFC